jgi:IclR family pca regulon transcriptional regulator
MSLEVDRAARRDTYVQSLERGLKILNAFTSETPQMTLSEIALVTGLSRAAARRFLLTLEELGYVEMRGRKFQLTIKVLDFGYSYLSALSLPEIAQPHLERLAIALHESASASVLDGQDIVYVARVPVRKIMSIGISIGTRMPAHYTSMGRVLLAGLTQQELRNYFESVKPHRYTENTILKKAQLMTEIDKVRKQGWAIVDQELELGLRSIATPITAQSGRVVAAINISTTIQSHTLESMRKKILPNLLESSQAISSDLKLWRPAVDVKVNLLAQRLV